MGSVRGFKWPGADRVGGVVRGARRFWALLVQPFGGGAERGMRLGRDGERASMRLGAGRSGPWIAARAVSADPRAPPPRDEEGGSPGLAGALAVGRHIGLGGTAAASRRVRDAWPAGGRVSCDGNARAVEDVRAPRSSSSRDEGPRGPGVLGRGCSVGRSMAGASPSGAARLARSRPRRPSSSPGSTRGARRGARSGVAARGSRHALCRAHGPAGVQPRGGGPADARRNPSWASGMTAARGARQREARLDPAIRRVGQGLPERLPDHAPPARIEPRRGAERFRRMHASGNLARRSRT